MEQGSEGIEAEKEAPLNADVRIEKFGGGFWPGGDYTPIRVVVGNTGLIIVPTAHIDRSYPYVWHQHYVPEGHETKPQGPGAKELSHKYGLVYPYAMNSFLKWWENPENFVQANALIKDAVIMDDFTLEMIRFYGYNLPSRPDYLVGDTNPTMRAFHRKLFGTGNGIYEESTGITYPYFDGFSGSSPTSYRLYLDKLAQNYDVRKKLKERSKICEESGFVMKVSTET